MTGKVFQEKGQMEVEFSSLKKSYEDAKDLIQILEEQLHIYK